VVRVNEYFVDTNNGSQVFAIRKAMGPKDIKTTMIYVDVAKPHIREQVEKLDRIQVLPTPRRYAALTASRSAERWDGPERAMFTGATGTQLPSLPPHRLEERR